MHNTAHYFKKHQINPKDILYIYRRNYRTVICFDSRDELISSIPVRDMAALLPEDEFIPIIQGTLVNRDRIVNISHDGVYTMSDEKTFQGRKRYMSFHRKLRRKLFPESIHNSSEVFVPPLGFYEKCSILDHMPIAYCVIELVFDENGHGIDKNLTIHCYQPEAGFCACVLVPDEG